uniref:hypothetical protein n=1 Tax=Burkholderia anthina TaxID=179879 RepID=UPI001FC85B62|nr:hypothetical protein [Burkholderia anthina]
MMARRIVCATASAFAMTATAGAAEPLVPGSTAPAELVQKLRHVQSVSIGVVSVRPVADGTHPAASAGNSGASASMRAQSMPTGSETTTVVRSSDNLVGVSTNDLVVIHPDTSAVSQSLRGQPVSVRAWPDMGIVVVHAGSFDQLAPLKAMLSTKFPTARFDLPVKYFETLPQ